jgi:hypothetical protein
MGENQNGKGRSVRCDKGWWSAAAGFARSLCRETSRPGDRAGGPSAYLNPSHLLLASPPHCPLGALGCDKIGATMDGNTANPKADLRPVIARLREIERKCASMGARNEEFPQMQERVKAIIARLEAEDDPSGAPPDYRRMARDLFPVAHLFESTGFMSVGKEIAHIERSLNEFAPPTSAEGHRPSSAGATSRASSSAAVQLAKPAPEILEKAPASTSVPRPVVAGFLLLALVAAGSAAVIFGVGPFARNHPSPEATISPEPTKISTVPPEPSPALSPEPATSPLSPPTAIPRGRLAEEVAAARLALAKGDLETAGVHLSEAGRIDRTDGDVKEIAEVVVRGLVSWAYGAAENAEWDATAPLLERAERTAMRFGIATAGIDTARSRIAAMDHYVLVGTGDRQIVLQSVGKRTEVTLADGTTLNGSIEGLDDANLILEMNRQVGGGVLQYSEDIPLASIRSLKIFEN